MTCLRDLEKIKKSAYGFVLSIDFLLLKYLAPVS